MFKFFYISEANKGGICAYCHEYVRKLTKEHVIPKMFGGTYTIKTCSSCNSERGHSFTYIPFVNWARAHPKEFQHAIDLAISNDPSKEKTIRKKTANI